jgi:LytS/YehU family sensor histidine kinase
VGLENIRKRLALAYPEQHTLSLKADSQSFHTQLLIQL